MFRHNVLPTGAAIALLTLCASLAAGQQIAFTFDDLPAHSTLPPGETRQHVAATILAALKQAGLPPVTGFVNGVRVEEQPDTESVLDAWRTAGFPLGNHAWSHMNLNQHTPEEFENDILRNEPLLQKHMPNADWHWLRFPNLAEGNTPEKRAKVRAFLLEHHYRVAGVTMSFGDYAWNEPYARCSVKGDSAAIQSLEAGYLKAAEQSIDSSREMAKALYGHDIPYVLLMHLGAFDARMLPRLLALYKQRGFEFVTLEQAEKDPFYISDIDLTSTLPDTLEAAMFEKNLRLPASHVGLPAELATICR